MSGSSPHHLVAAVEPLSTYCAALGTFTDIELKFSGTWVLVTMQVISISKFLLSINQVVVYASCILRQFVGSD